MEVLSQAREIKDEGEEEAIIEEPSPLPPLTLRIPHHILK